MKAISPTPNLVEQVRDALLNEIASGQLQPGERIIQEQIAQALGVSRQPVQQALLLLRDSIPQTIESVETTDSLNQNFQLHYAFAFNKNYMLIIPKGSCEDLCGIKNDSVIIKFKTREERDYGSIELNFVTQKNQGNLILQLVNMDDKPVRSFRCSGSKKINLENIIPAQYRLRCITDLNNDGRWNRGNYFARLQPEPVVYYSETINVRANWDVEINWTLK